MLFKSVTYHEYDGKYIIKVWIKIVLYYNENVSKNKSGFAKKCQIFVWYLKQVLFRKMEREKQISQNRWKYN